MINLLEETKSMMEEHGYSSADIVFIGCESTGHSCTWEQFEQLADKNYDNGYGWQKVMGDLIIVMSDGSRMDRGEYGGSEWWKLTKPFRMPESIREIESLFMDSNTYNSRFSEIR